jgi:hypothetical protein
VPRDYVLNGRTKRERYLQLKQALYTERSSFDAHWRDLATWVRPRRERFAVTDRNRGDRRNQAIIDNTATTALRTLQSGMHAGMTSPARPWFALTTPDPALAEFGPVKAWLHTVTQRLQILFLRSNVYNSLHTIYGDMGLFGTGALMVWEDLEDFLHTGTYAIGTYAVAMGVRGRPTTFVREYDLTVEQLIEEFGGVDGRPLAPRERIDRSRFSPHVLNAWDLGNYQTPVRVCWVVTRNRAADASRLDASRWPIVSCTFEVGQSQEDPQERYLREGGFDEWPVLVPRWDATDEDAYGSDCPGMVALGDVRQLQAEQKRKGQALEKTLNPPVTAPTHLRTQQVSLIAGRPTYVDLREGQSGIKPIHEVKYPVSDVTMDIREVQYRIRQAFFADLFLMLGQSDPSRGAQPLTAREVEERHEEKLMALGPVLERTNKELLDPLIDRVYSMAQRASQDAWARGEDGLLPRPPADLEDVDLGVRYTSIMAAALKMVGIAATDRFVRSVGAVSTAWPEALFKVDGQQLVDEYAEQTGVSPRVVRADEEAAAMVQAAQQAAARQQQVEEAAVAAKSTREMSAASLADDSALRRIVEGGAR